ncbi:hypothetical protein [Amycolatopsis sp. MEPSY49]|uniref:hypothetical protein n=1 Tax=Amycolatopsis sp. MEPSY49 TaxID=3151600 RepID=UPI003EF3EF0F
MTTGQHRAVRRKHAGLKAMAGRLSWGLGDQAVSSLTNFAIGVFVARELGVTAFGLFSLAWVTYGVLINVSRGLATDPLMVRFSHVDVDVWRPAVARASATALVVGLLAGAVSVVFGIAAGGTFGSAFVALGIILPALLLQDSWRFAFFAAGEPRKAFLNDVVWGVAMIPTMLLAKLHPTVVTFLLAWGGGAAAAAGYGYAQTRLRPALAGVRTWLRDHRDLGTRYLIENVSNSSGSQIRMYGLGAIAGVAAVGTVRGGELLLGPFVAVLMGLAFVAVPEAARVVKRDVRKLPRFGFYLGGAQAFAALLWGGALLLVLNDRLGEFVLGDVWHTAKLMIIPATLSVFNASFIGGAATGLRALGAAKRSMRCQLIASGLYVAGGLIGAVVGGAVGSGWGVASATFIAAFIWWIQLHLAVRAHTRTPQETRTP